MGTFDKLTIVIELEALAACEIGLIVGNFETADGREGAEFRLIPPSGTGKVTPGGTRLEIDLRELPFASGQYILNLALFDETRSSDCSIRSSSNHNGSQSQITNFQTS